MAYIHGSGNTPAASANSNGSTGNGKTQEKALSFINISVPVKGGTKRLISVPLNASKPLEKALHDALVSGGQDMADRLASSFALTFNLNNSDAPVELDF